MANGIKIGNLDISAFKVGSSDCKVYLGDTLLYPTAPPSFQGKWLATYNGGTTASAECGASSAITRNEITKTNLVTVEIGNCVTSIGTQAFNGCSTLSSIVIPDSVTSIGTYAFYNCSGLASVTIGSSVTSIGTQAFLGCSSLTSIVIPDSVTNIADYAFYNCSGLTSVTIGSSVTSIGTQAFNGCSSLTSVTCLASTPPTLGSNVFVGTNDCPIYVPSGHVNAYQSAWSTYASRIHAIPI